MKLYDPKSEKWIPFSEDKFIEFTVLYGHALLIHSFDDNVDESVIPNEYTKSLKEYFTQPNSKFRTDE